MKFQTPHEQFCFETATSFTAIRGVGKTRTRSEFSTFAEAVEHAKQINDNRTMIYAINALGNSAHICNR